MAVPMVCARLLHEALGDSGTHTTKFYKGNHQMDASPETTQDKHFLSLGLLSLTHCMHTVHPIFTIRLFLG